jgi:hypothetical protein
MRHSPALAAFTEPERAQIRGGWDA